MLAKSENITVEKLEVIDRQSKMTKISTFGSDQPSFDCKYNMTIWRESQTTDEDSYLWKMTLIPIEYCDLPEKLEFTFQDKEFEFFTSEKVLRFSVNIVLLMTFSILSISDQLRSLYLLENPQTSYLTLLPLAFINGMNFCVVAIVSMIFLMMPESTRGFMYFPICMLVFNSLVMYKYTMKIQ